MGIIQKIFKSPEALANRLSNLKPDERVIYMPQLSNYGDDRSATPSADNVTGVTGTAISGFNFQEEYLSELKGYNGSKMYEKMMRQDYQIAYLENATIDPIKSANFGFTIPDVNNGAEHAELCEWQLKKGTNKTLNENLNDMMSYITFGFAAFEPTKWSAYNHKKFGKIWKLDSFGFRDQKSIIGWKVKDDAVEYIMQQAMDGDTYKDVKILGENLIILSNKRRGANFEGISMFRAAYGCYWRKQIYLKILGIGLEKSALGMIIVKVPPAKLGSKEETAFLTGVKNYITHENSYLKAANGKDGNGFDVEVITVDFKSDAVINAIKHEDASISKCGGVQFSELGQGGNGGAYNLGVSQVDFHFTMLKNKALYIGEKFQPIFDNLIRYNFGEQDAYPELKITGLDDAIGESLARVLNMLIVSGVFKPTPEDEAYLRKAYNMPERSMEQIEETPDPASDDAEPDDDNDPEPDPDIKADNKADNKLASQPPAYVKKAAKGIDFKKFTKQYDQAMETYNKTINSNLLAIQSKYINDVANVIKFNPNNPLKAITNLSFGKTKDLERSMDKNIVETLKIGKQQGADVIAAKEKNIKKKLAINDISAASKKWKNNVNAVTISAMLGDFKKKAEIAAQTQIDLDQPIKTVLFEVTNAMDAFRNNSNNLGGGAIIPKALEKGRDETYKEADIELIGWLYRNLDPVTAICQWLNDRAAKDGDPDIDLYSPPNHWNCKSFKIPIFSDEDAPEVWDGWDVPPTVASAQELLTNKCGCDIFIPEIYKFMFEKGA